MSLEIPQSVSALIQAIQTQTRMITTISSGGAGLIILTWFRVLGLKEDIDLRSFKWPLVLILPLCLFVICLIISYIISAAISGYYAELLIGKSSSCGDCPPINDAAAHFIEDYFVLQSIGAVQLLSGIIGLLILTGWYILNGVTYFKARR